VAKVRHKITWGENFAGVTGVNLPLYLPPILIWDLGQKKFYVIYKELN
jgi:hypothetical protein